MTVIIGRRELLVAPGAAATWPLTARAPRGRATEQRDELAPLLRNWIRGFMRQL